MALRVLIRGGGDLGSGVALRLVRSGAQVLITELEKPMVVRRAASYANAIYLGKCKVEETRGYFCREYDEVTAVLAQGEVPVMIDPAGMASELFRPQVVVDARMLKSEPGITKESAHFVIGLGPGFIADIHCHAIIETKRGHTLGRVYWTGTGEADTQTPDPVSGYAAQRILRAPVDGIIKNSVKIGDLVAAGQLLTEVENHGVVAEFAGVVRGLIANGLYVQKGVKIGDIDPRRDPRLCYIVSDKALAVGGGVLEAILSREELRTELCSGN